MHRLVLKCLGRFGMMLWLILIWHVSGFANSEKSGPWDSPQSMLLQTLQFPKLHSQQAWAIRALGVWKLEGVWRGCIGFDNISPDDIVRSLHSRCWVCSVDAPLQVELLRATSRLTYHNLLSCSCLGPRRPRTSTNVWFAWKPRQAFLFLQILASLEHCGRQKDQALSSGIVIKVGWCDV